MFNSYSLILCSLCPSNKLVYYETLSGGLMRKLIFLSISLFSVFSLAQLEDTHNNPNLYCTVENGTFVVSNYEKTWKKNFLDSSSSLPFFECGKNSAAAIIGSSFVYFSLKNQRFDEKYIFTMTKRPVLKLADSTAAAFVGSYLLVAQEGRGISEHYIMSNTTSSELFLEISKNNVFMIFGGYEYVYYSGQYYENYLFSDKVLDFKTSGGKSALVTKSYFKVFSDGRFYEKSIFGNLKDFESMFSGKGCFAFATSNYFFVFDTIRNQFLEKFIFSEGKIVSLNRMPLFVSNNGDRILYNPSTGQFVEL